GMLGLSFMVVYREMFEAGLFFRGLLLEVPGTGAAVAAGAAAGLLTLVGLVAAFQRVGRRLRPRPLLLSCGILLCLLAVLMVGHGVRSLQILGALPLTVWGAFQVPALGVYATREGLLAQALVVLLLALSALWTALRRDREDGGSAGRSAAAAAEQPAISSSEAPASPPPLPRAWRGGFLAAASGASGAPWAQARARTSQATRITTSAAACAEARA